MSDATYQPKIYKEPNGDKQIVASGGEVQFESGSTLDIQAGTTVTDAGTKTQSAKNTVASGGETEYQSGSVLDLQNGASFYAGSTQLSARTIELDFLSRQTITYHGSAAIVSVGSTLTPAYGYHVFSAATGFSLGKFSMPAASAGAFLNLNGAYLVTDANLSVNCPSATAKVLNGRNSDLSSFELSAAGYVSMTCATDGTWAIIDQYNILEHPSS